MEQASCECMARDGVKLFHFKIFPVERREEGSKDLGHAAVLVRVAVISHGGHLNHYHSILFPFIPVNFQTFSMLQPKQFF